MGEQIDNAGPRPDSSDTFDAQKAYDEATPIPLSDEKIEKIVRAVVDAPTDFQRKVAEAIYEVVPSYRHCDTARREDAAAGVQRIKDAIAAVLAAKQVVDSEEVEEAEQIRWQKAIDELVIKVCPDRDGSGCESGDPLDLTLTEISEAFGHLEQQLAALHETHERVVEERDDTQRKADDIVRQLGEAEQRLAALREKRAEAEKHLSMIDASQLQGDYRQRFDATLATLRSTGASDA